MNALQSLSPFARSLPRCMLAQRVYPAAIHTTALSRFPQGGTIDPKPLKLKATILVDDSGHIWFQSALSLSFRSKVYDCEIDISKNEFKFDIKAQANPQLTEERQAKIAATEKQSKEHKFYGDSPTGC